MPISDRLFLLLQFKNKINTKIGTEFQSFFEDIMEKAHDDFRKIRPYGNEGDGGNDGYRPKLGVYYQIYSPREPNTKDAVAAKKFEEDFNKLKKEWDKISKIKNYYFVFNDKYDGSIQKIEATKAELEKENPEVEFELFLAKDLEKEFFELDESQMLELGFNLDSRETILIVNKYLENVEIQLDRECVNIAHRILERCKEIVTKIDDRELIIKCEILEGRCLIGLEKVDEAIILFENLTKRYPDDSRSFLHLANISLSKGDSDKNRELLGKAETIDSDNVILKLEKLVRVIHLSEQINLEEIDEDLFSDNKRYKASFYRLYALLLEKAGSKEKVGFKEKAESFIENAIFYNPDRLSNYIVKISFMVNRIFADIYALQSDDKLQQLLDEINRVEDLFSDFGDITSRNIALLNIYRIEPFKIIGESNELCNVIKNSFESIISCHFNQQIDELLILLLRSARFPDDAFENLLKYLNRAQDKLSPALINSIMLHFIDKNNLQTEGRKFFEEIHSPKGIDFIDSIENKRYDDVLPLFDDDIQFAVLIATNPNIPSDLRKKIIEILPEDKNIKKEILNVLLNSDNNNFDDALDIINNLDLTSLNYCECKSILEVIQKKKVWEYAIIIMQKLLEKESNPFEIININLQLCSANINLKRYPEAIQIGKQILGEDLESNVLDFKNKEALLTNTLFSCLERGKIDEHALRESLVILEKYQISQPSFEFKVGIESQVYLENRLPNKALQSIIEGIEIRKNPTAEEYARLYFMLIIEIGNQVDLALETEKNITINSFVKFKNDGVWYFIGESNQLDAQKIPRNSSKYNLLMNRKIGGRIATADKYNPQNNRDEEVELIYSTKEYILWQVRHNFKKLSESQLLDNVQIISTPHENEAIDLQYLLKYLEDSRKRTEPFFELFCKGMVPVALLSHFEGGFEKAIGRIKNENAGYISFSTGDFKDLNEQMRVAKMVTDSELPFYIDGTSAFVLSEVGLLNKICCFLPNIKIPQAVLSYLIDIAGKFKYTPGNVGTMGYGKGKISFVPVNQEVRARVYSQLKDSVNIFESKPENIGFISSANKEDCLSERDVDSELCDACILAQKEALPIFTDDFLYLRMNEAETQKQVPEFFSSFALLRVLYEDGKISFEEYLDAISYLSYNRFRFVAIFSGDIKKAVFGDGKIKTINYDNLRKFNFPVTLSKEYGVSFETAFNTLGRFFYETLVDISILPEVVERLFVEILELFPVGIEKRILAQKLITTCIQTFDRSSPTAVITMNKTMQMKIVLISNAKEIYQ